ncbi:hypothetical protein GCM10027431_08120 [Lysobacter rhizosphaerae]
MTRVFPRERVLTEDPVMHPIKTHRIVLESAAMVASSRDRCGDALASAENEGWPPERPQPMAMRRAGEEAMAALSVIQATVMRGH